MSQCDDLLFEKQSDFKRAKRLLDIAEEDVLGAGVFDFFSTLVKNLGKKVVEEASKAVAEAGTKAVKTAATKSGAVEKGAQLFSKKVKDPPVPELPMEEKAFEKKPVVPGEVMKDFAATEGKRKAELHRQASAAIKR